MHHTLRPKTKALPLTLTGFIVWGGFVHAEPGSTTAGFYANRAEAENGEPVDIIVGFAGLDDAIRYG